MASAEVKPDLGQASRFVAIDFVSRKREGYFYYVMELGDMQAPGWEREPATYKPMT